MIFVAKVRLKRPDNQLVAKREVMIQAPDLETAEAMCEEAARAGGYTGYRLDEILSLEPA